MGRKIAIAGGSGYISKFGTNVRIFCMPSIECVIFDVDGTLTRTNDLIFASFNFVTKKYLNREFSPAEIIPLFGPPEEGALARIFPAELVGKAMDDLCSFYEHQHDALASLHPGIEGAVALIRCRKAYTAVFTGKGRKTAEITLRKLGIFRLFDLIVSGNDVRKHKPDPEGIERVLRTFSIDPGRALMVGDSLGDLRAARAAGVPIAAALWDSYDRERLRVARPDYWFETVNQFTVWLGNNLPPTTNRP